MPRGGGWQPPSAGDGPGRALSLSHRAITTLLSPREYEHEAVRRRFTRARDDSDQDEGYEWGPATDV